MKTYVTVSNSLINAILEGLHLPDAQKAGLLDGAGISPESIRNITEGISILQMARLWASIVAVTNDEFIGLQIGKSVSPEKFGLAVHAAQSSPTLRQVLTRFAENVRLINEMIRSDVEVSGKDASFLLNFYWDIFDLERHAVDVAFANFCLWAQKALNEKLLIRSVHLKHTFITARQKYEEVFDAPVIFGATRNELIFDSEALDLEVSTANPELGLILDHFAKIEVAKKPVPDDLPARVSQIISNALETGLPIDLTITANHLRTTRRTLQRQLNGISTSFSILLDQARKSLAPKYLSRPSVNVEQVGFYLGYAEPTSFIRAFKKWYGVTPGEYRRRQES